MNNPAYDIIIKDAQEIITHVGKRALKLSGKTVVVTGANGVVGSCIIDTLHLLNQTRLNRNPVRCICVTRHKVTPNSRIGYLLGTPHVHMVTADVTKHFKLSYKPDYIIHSASYASPKTYLAKPIETMEANSIGTKRMLDLARHSHCQNMLFISSGAVYGESRQGEGPFTEDHCGYVSPLETRAVYSESKRFGETLCLVYARFYGVHTTVARLSNMFGPGFRLDDGRAIPDFFNQAFTKKAIEINGDPLATRAYLYISDAVAGIFDILLEGQSGEVYNIASEKALTMREVARIVCSFFARCQVFVKKDLTKGYVLSSAKTNISSAKKMRQSLGWHPTVDMREGLRRLYTWYRWNLHLNKI